MEEHTVQCPFCWEPTSMLLDTSVKEQTYIEDCQVCCNALEIHVVFLDGKLNSLNVVALEY